MQRTYSGDSSKRRGRWNPRSSSRGGKPNERRISGDLTAAATSAAASSEDDDASINRSSDNPLKVNGMPDWENPMAVADSGVNTSPHKSPDKKPPPRKVSSGRMSISGGSSEDEPRLQRRSSINGAMPRRGSVGPTPSPTRSPYQPQPHQQRLEEAQYAHQQRLGEGQYGNVAPNFVNMVIECDFSDSESCGDITYDESVVNDEDFHKTHYNYNRNRRAAAAPPAAAVDPNPPRMRSHLQNYNCRSPPKQPQRKPSLRERHQGQSPHQHHQMRGGPHEIPDDQRRSEQLQLDQQSPQRSVEEEERRLIELAMERSLQDSSTHLGSHNGSLMSESRRSETSLRRRTSTGSSSSRSRSSDLSSADCHITMLAARNRPGSLPSSPERGTPPCEAGPDFAWKREGKKWLKVPVAQPAVTAFAVADNLHAIEEDEESLQDSLIHQSVLGMDRHGMSLMDRTANSGMSGEEVLEQMEREMIEEAMHRSMSTLSHQQGSPSSMRESSLTSLSNSRGPGSSSGGVSSILHLSSDRVADNDHDAALARLQEQEEEKAMIELAMQQSMQGTTAQGSSRRSSITGSQTSRGSSHGRRTLNRAYSAQSTSSDLSAAGCHLAMVGQQRRLSHEPSRRGLDRTHSNDSRHSSGNRLVWRRGPNNVWGRFPDEEEEELDEEELIAEVMQRSMRDM